MFHQCLASFVHVLSTLPAGKRPAELHYRTGSRNTHLMTLSGNVSVPMWNRSITDDASRTHWIRHALILTDRTADSTACWLVLVLMNVLFRRQTLISVQPFVLRLRASSLVFFRVTDSRWKRQSQNHTCSSSKLWSSSSLSLFPTVWKWTTWIRMSLLVFRVPVWSARRF